MMKISIKLGLWFFICIFIIETCSMIYLHRNVVHSLVNEELSSLKARGNSHRDVLEMSSDNATLHHIGLMESQTDTEVVITNTDGDVLETSKVIDDGMEKILSKTINDIPRNGLILQSDLQNEKYIATVSSFDGGKENQGYVYMFKSKDHIHNFISQLNNHFLLAALLILFFMLITIFFLSRALTKPLVSMKEATRKLSNGDFSVSLPVTSNDEIGELSKSIQTLANDLNYLKKERNEFLASISHELRTPLTYIKGYADIGRRKALDETERINYLNIIHEEADHVSDLLKELFELAKMDQNAFSISKERTHICLFLQSIFGKVLPAFKSKGIHLELNCKEDFFVKIDPIRFEQVFLNLLDNALKYSKENSTTTIEVLQENKNIIIFIKDQGKGIPYDDLPYIFDRLYRVDKSRSRLTGGYGLGLAIVKEIVEAHSGEISADSQDGKGTCFKIVLKEQ
ncbi:sensor histidine kinase [Metabacillus bambusae]|uniref:histidine kinase n=1 Tax=Metabacillus bambusae TaxID=2795218 RepID=A0ABS3MZ54_9BACI|nr:HAMP domain-containing sensor histidine kinase [Metabacillus bambusae]MBO1511311.1 HAMP domain-containing histidine kinase [Metabacillus bambusae]